MRILMLSPVAPVRLDTGTKRRIWCLAKALRQAGCEVGLVARASAAEIERSEELREVFSDLALVPIREPGAPRRIDSRLPGRLLRVGLQLANGFPPFAALAYHPLLEEAVRRLAPAYDVVFVEFFFMASNVPPDLMRRDPRKFALVEHDVSYVPKWRAWRAAQGFDRVRRWIEYRAFRRAELHSLRRFERIAAMSRTDASLLAELRPGADIIVVPNGVDADAFPARPRQATRDGPPRLLYVGGLAHHPNFDAVRHYAQRYMPHLRARFPGTRLLVAGDTAGREAEISALAGDGVRLLGFTPDLAELYAECDALLVPLRIAGGTRLKILEAMAAGAPVVSTRVGAEGIEARDGVEILLAETPEEAGDALETLRRSPSLALAISENAKRLVRDRYDWKGIARDLAQALESANPPSMEM